MFTEKNYKTLALTSNLAWYSGAVPFFFKKSTRKGDLRLMFETAKSRKRLVAVSFFLNLFYILFLAFRVLEKALIYMEESSLEFMVKMGYLLSAYSLPVVLQINTFLHWEDTFFFLVQYIKFFKQIQRKYLAPTDNGSKCMKFFSTVLLIGCLVTIQNVVIIMKRPYEGHFFTSILEDPKAQPFLLRMPFLVCNFWVWANTWTNIWIFCFHQYMYMTCGIFMMKELDVNIKSPRTSNRLREAKNCFKILRSMQTLHGIWRMNFQHWFCPTHKTTAICIATLSLYGVVKLSGPRSIVMGFVAVLSLLYLSTLFYKYGKFHETSSQTLRNWKNSSTSSKYMKKFIASVPVLKIEIGDFYYIKKTTVIMVLYTVLNNTITLFLL